MREIKFRARPTTGGYLWVYGNAVIQINRKAYLFEDTDGCAGVFEDGDPESSCYIVDGLLEVFPETVGQYTGLKDKNGKEIYEWDIIAVKYNGVADKCICSYEDGSFGVKHLIGDAKNFGEVGAILGFSPFICFPHLRNIEIIGNIHDNKLEDFYGR